VTGETGGDALVISVDKMNKVDMTLSRLYGSWNNAIEEALGFG